MCKVVAVCVTHQKGEPTLPVGEIELLERREATNDGYCDGEHSVRLMSVENLLEARSQCPDLVPVTCFENITVSDLYLEELPAGTRLWVGDKAVLEVTGSGNTHDILFNPQQHGVCTHRPRGLFARVVSGGTVRKGDQVVILSLGGKNPPQN